MLNKSISWISSSREDLRNFPKPARRKAGLELRALQRGEMPTDFKSMSSIGPGVMEIRINVGNTYRIFYVAKFEESIYILHAFQKKAQRTSPKDIQLARQRYRMMVRYRQG